MLRTTECFKDPEEKYGSGMKYRFSNGLTLVEIDDESSNFDTLIIKEIAILNMNRVFVTNFFLDTSGNNTYKIFLISEFPKLIKKVNACADKNILMFRGGKCK